LSDATMLVSLYLDTVDLYCLLPFGFMFASRWCKSFV
jgi:hypothetical protein